jgi:2-polyprenyl-6-hydroxyphenyl methylase/3-demethylubiquinone-9 3-methyltransferase
LSEIAEDATVDAGEVGKFAAMAEEWWSAEGKFAPLHKFNPVRLRFIRETAAEHFRKSPSSLHPFDGLKLLDIGCGGGLLSEPMARLGFAVTGADASARNIEIARLHAAQSGLSVDYRCTTAEALADAGFAFDVVLNMEVVEHVADLALYLRSCARLVAPGGLMFVATLNRTLKAFALAKVGAEYVLGWLPRGTHDWSRFVEPKRLRAMLEESGLAVRATQGISFDPLSWDWRLSSDTDVNYVMVAEKEGDVTLPDRTLSGNKTCNDGSNNGRTL